MTRILQESLGGNSRTTLIINCSPSQYNETETLSTLRFGMRAKSIKNKARVNAELSPAELKTLLKKAQRDVGNYASYIALLEQEVNAWRNGGQVEKEAWASMEKALGLGEGELEKLVGTGSSGANGLSVGSTPGGSAPRSGRATPRLPQMEKIGEGEVSRPMTPMEKDEREEFMRRQNDLEDQLANTVRSPSSTLACRSNSDPSWHCRNRNSRLRRKSFASFAKNSRASRSRRRLSCRRTSR